MKAYGQITLSVVNDGAPGIPGTPALNIVISNESQSIPCASNGLVSKQILLEIPFCGYEGFNKVACDVSVGNLPSGMTQVTENATPDKDGKIILNVSKNASLGGADILNGKVPLSFTLKGKTITKQFVWSKVKDGSAGSSARIYTVHPSTLIVKKLPGDKFSPETLTFSATYKDGNSASLNSYLGRFIIERSTNGASFETVYSSASDESQKTYTVQSSDVAIKCTLCASGSLVEQLDFQTVSILTDAESIIDEVEKIQTTVSEVKVNVDQLNKDITLKASKSDITEEINKYDKSSVQGIRDQVAEVKIDSESIKNTVKDVETKLEKKADGSTVQSLSEKVSQAIQDAEGFKQTVEKTYVAKTDKLGARNLLRNSKSIIFDNYNFITDISIYLINENNDFLVDENNNFLITN